MLLKPLLLFMFTHSPFCAVSPFEETYNLYFLHRTTRDLHYGGYGGVVIIYYYSSFAQLVVLELLAKI